MSLPEWLIERVALDEVTPASRGRVARADGRELAERVGALREENAAELARHPARPAVAQIEARVAAESRERKRRLLRRLSWLGVAGSAAAVLIVARLAVEKAGTDEVRGADTGQEAGPEREQPGPEEDTRVKGSPRLVAFRHVGEQVERLAADAIVRAGDVIQLRYSPAGQGYGVIASVDGAGVVTLHFPLSEDAAPEATAMSSEKTALPNAYALDDAPRFERFFFITANSPVDVRQALAAVRSLARREDSATASLELPAGVRQWSLRLRKADRTSNNHESP